MTADMTAETRVWVLEPFLFESPRQSMQQWRVTMKLQCPEPPGSELTAARRCS